MRNIEILHHFDDYECMWNGIEDIYIQTTGEHLPPNLFFSLASFGSFTYIKTEKSELKRMVALGDGRTKQMYKFLAPIVGFEYRHYESKSFSLALKKAKAEIDHGYPVVLGALDMFHLSYLHKMYHIEHIPFHYVLMIGYDETSESITLLDCGREEPQQLSYCDLERAWNCSSPGISKPFTLCTIRMSSPRSKEQIADEALRKKAELFLHPSVGFTGYRGFERFIFDLPKWRKQLGEKKYYNQLFNMVQFYGLVPTIPNALKGVKGADEISFCGGFDRISLVLSELGKEYKNRHWVLASSCFGSGADVVTEIKDVIVDYLIDANDQTEKLPQLYTTIKDIMVNGFEILYDGAL